MPAPRGNQHNKQENPRSHMLQVRVKPQDKHAWCQAAQKEGLSLSAWVEKTLNKESER